MAPDSSCGMYGFASGSWDSFGKCEMNSCAIWNRLSWWSESQNRFRFEHIERHERTWVKPAIFRLLTWVSASVRFLIILIPSEPVVYSFSSIMTDKVLSFLDAKRRNFDTADNPRWAKILLLVRFLTLLKRGILMTATSSQWYGWTTLAQYLIEIAEVLKTFSKLALFNKKVKKRQL